MDEMDGPQEAGKRLYGHVELDLCVSHGRCKDRRRKEEWVARLYGLSDPGLGSIEVAACDAHVALDLRVFLCATTGHMAIHNMNYTSRVILHTTTATGSKQLQSMVLATHGTMAWRPMAERYDTS